MSSNETAAYEIMKSLDVDYVLIIFGGVIGYSGDDINKFLWMVRIAEGEHPRDIRVRPGLRQRRGRFDVPSEGEKSRFPSNVEFKMADQSAAELTAFLRFLHRKAITSPPRGSSGWIKPVPPRCSTA